MLRSRLRTQVRRYRKALEAGDPKSLGGMLSETLSLIDRSAKLGIIHDNAAARTKSRLTLALGRISKS
jgi:small subunit ribosomal protein S20